MSGKLELQVVTSKQRTAVSEDVSVKIYNCVVLEG